MNGQNNRDMRSSSAYRYGGETRGSRPQGSYSSASRQGARPQGSYGSAPQQGARPQGGYSRAPQQGARPQGSYSSAPRQGARPQGSYGSAPRPGARSQGNYSSAPRQGARPQGSYSSAPRQGARPQGGYGSAPQARPAAPQRRLAQPQRSRKPRKPGDNIILKILKVIAFVFLAIFAGIGKVFSFLNSKLDRFRKGETVTVIVNCIAGGVIVVILLCVMMIFKADIDSARAGSYAAKGKPDAALKIVSRLEEDGYAPEKLHRTRVDVVEGFIDSGCHSEAASLITELPEGSEKTELTRRNSYAQGIACYEAGEYTEAAQIFYQIEDYEDSALWYADCRCALAIQAWQRGDEAAARSLLLDVPDVVNRVQKAAYIVADDEAGAQAILAAELFSPANLNAMEETMQHINEARSDMPQGRIAAGRHHTLGLRTDGTVLATGDNSMGQCGVGGWSGITQVAAGAFHSVGLRADGTVLAVGDNSQNQCDVSGWTDIVAIACGSADTIGLRSDGTVVAAGMHSDLVTGWHNVTFVSAGSYSMGCLYDKGAMLSSHKSAQMDMGVVLYDLSICGQVSVGVLYDGTMISTFDGIPQWSGVVSATAHETGVLAIDSDGKVLSHFYRPGDAVEISVPGVAVEVESCGTHHVVLTEDGKVYAFGENDYGQCATSGWQL